MSEKLNNYEVEVFEKDNKIIVMGKIRPIRYFDNEDKEYMMMTDSYDYFSRCESCVYFKSYYFDEYDSDCYCSVFDEFKKGYCEKFERLKDD